MAERITPEHRARIEQAKACGCIACHINAQLGDFKPTGMWTEYHHFKSGNKRRGHEYGAGLCHWHHQAKFFPADARSTSYTENAKVYGPSLEREPAKFRDTYGDDAFLLEFQNRLLELPGLAEVSAA